MEKNNEILGSRFPILQLIQKLEKYPLKVLWKKSFEGRYNELFDIFYSFCQIGDKFISLHGEMNIETFHKRRVKNSLVAKLFKCEYKISDIGLIQISKEFIGLGADPRMVSDGKNAYAYVVGYGEAKHPAFLYKEKDDSLYPIKAEFDFDWGKNWQPFLKEGRLYIVHELAPFSVYEINIETYQLKRICELNSDFNLPAHYTNHSMFRGGANAITENDVVYGLGRASAQPYKHLPFWWSSYKNEAPQIQFTDFFNRISDKGFGIIDPTSFFKKDENIYLGLACSETTWFHGQQFLNVLLVVDVENKYKNLPTLENLLSEYENSYENKLPNLKNHIFHCDRMQHDIPFSYEYGIKSTGKQGTLVYGPYIEIKDDLCIKIELSYLTLEKEGRIAGVFDVCLSKENEEGKIEQLKITECDLKTTNSEIATSTLFFDTREYQGYKVEFRVMVNKSYELNAFHIRTSEVKCPIPCVFLPTTIDVDNTNGFRSCQNQEGFLFFGPYHLVEEGGSHRATLYYNSQADKTEIAGVFDITVLSPEGEVVTIAMTEVYGTNNLWRSIELDFALNEYKNYKFETRFQVKSKKRISVSYISISDEISASKAGKTIDLIVRDRLEGSLTTAHLKRTKWHELRDRILSFIKLDEYSRTNTKGIKNIIVRKIFRILRLYPNKNFYHFYFERANSFMAPKMYEYTQMFKEIQFKKNDVVLDLGCGDGSLPLIIGKSVKKVVGIDTGLSGIENAKFKANELSKKIETEFHCIKLEEAGFQEKSFDKVVSFSVIEHIPNYLEIFEELFRLLKKDGELIISVDSFSYFTKEQRAIHQKNFDVVKYFEKNELHELLKGLGFKEVFVEPIFKSKFSKKWFTRVMNNPNEYFGTYKRLYSFFLYYIIKYYEKKNKQQEHGVFLVARCKK